MRSGGSPNPERIRFRETERKFLVSSDAFRREAVSVQHIVQGFLNRDPERTVRVRTAGEAAYLTVKGKTGDNGRSRFEWEQQISPDAAQKLLHLCELPLIAKKRYAIPVGSHIFEVDEFEGVNDGLVLAEVELQHEEEGFEKPAWLGREVTGIGKYYNAQLSIKPYQTWTQ